jgi:hypothetical protein
MRAGHLSTVLMNAELTTELYKTLPRCYSAVFSSFVNRDLSVTTRLQEIFREGSN